MPSKVSLEAISATLAKHAELLKAHAKRSSLCAFSPHYLHQPSFTTPNRILVQRSVTSLPRPSLFMAPSHPIRSCCNTRSINSANPTPLEAELLGHSRDPCWCP